MVCYTKFLEPHDSGPSLHGRSQCMHVVLPHCLPADLQDEESAQIRARERGNGQYRERIVLLLFCGLDTLL